MLLITSEQAITEGRPVRQPHCHHSGPINHMAGRDTCMCAGGGKKERKETRADSTHYVVDFNSGSSKNTDGEFERRETEVMGE